MTQPAEPYPRIKDFLKGRSPRKVEITRLLQYRIISPDLERTIKEDHDIVQEFPAMKLENERLRKIVAVMLSDHEERIRKLEARDEYLRKKEDHRL